MTYSEGKQLNYREMKRTLYIAAIASLLITSCQKTDILNVAEDTIDFSTEVGKLTKADYSEEKYSTLKDQGFRVWTFADFTLGNDVEGSIYREMANLSVVFGTNGFSIDSNNKYFWPASGNHLYFHVLSAKDSDWLDSIEYNTHFSPTDKKDGVNKLDLPTFTVKDTADDDIMVADSIRQDKADGKIVRPLFRHTMTKVMFNFVQGQAGTGENEADEASVVILKGIKTDELSNKGNLDVTYSSVEEDNKTTDDIDESKMHFKWTASNTGGFEFTGTPSDTLVIVKNSSTIIGTTVPESPSEGDMYAKYNKDDNSYTVYKYSAENSGEYVSETLTYDSTKERWSSDKYEAFKGVVLTSEMTNFVTWYMIPQELTADDDAKTVKISYVADGKHIDQNFSLKGTTVTKWSEELCVKYNVTIAPHKIQFNPSVEDWDTYEVGMDN